MNRRQAYEVVLVAVICILAVPGFLQVHSDARSASSARGRSQQIELDLLTERRIPDTKIDLEPTSEQQKNIIRESWRVNVNEASEEELRSIDTLGSRDARRIVDYRDQGNVFYRLEDLQQVARIGSSTVEKIRPYATVGRNYMDEAPEERPSASATASADPSEPSEPEEPVTVDLNTASAEEFRSIPGIGEAKSNRIVNYRENTSYFDEVEDFKNVSGVGPETFERFKEHLEVSTSPREARRLAASDHDSSQDADDGEQVNINTAGMEELQTLWGIGEANARRIIEYREEHGDFSEVDELENVTRIGPATVNNLRGEATVR